MIPCILA
jgi:hypothetical protein